MPIGIAAVLMLLPAVRQRIMTGFDGESESGIIEADDSKITSGRTAIWPYVLEKIGEAPIIGYGRLAMRRTGLTNWLSEELSEDFGHPHNAYLEQLLDNGIVGFLAIIPFFFLSLREAFRLFRDRTDSLVAAVGGASFALILSLLVGSLAGQTFYPREGAVGMWVAIGLMLRVSVQRSNSHRSGSALFQDDATDGRRGPTSLPVKKEAIPA